MLTLSCCSAVIEKLFFFFLFFQKENLWLEKIILKTIGCLDSKIFLQWKKLQFKVDFATYEIFFMKLDMSILSL